MARFTDAQVKEIRALYASGVKRAEIARRFGVGSTTIFHIVREHTWTHLLPQGA